ncbi:MAG TPA: hypothetical protein VL171_11405 [Verrucomicrobiae bacterium]|nr:hypothetical protein [Verrucomicrobiae bacterium]
MQFRRKPADPIDRAIGDLDEKIAALQRQLRELEIEPGQGLDQAPTRRFSTVSAQGLSRFVGNMLRPKRRVPDPSHSMREDLFEVTAEPLKDLEAEPITFANKPEPDLFTGPPAAIAGASTALETAEVVPSDKKLAHYLGAGSIKSYKPLKHVQRQMRNRFFMWLGLSFAALWIIWFVIR